MPRIYIQGLYQTVYTYVSYGTILCIIILYNRYTVCPYGCIYMYDNFMIKFPQEIYVMYAIL